MMLSFYVLHFTFDRGLRFWSALLVFQVHRPVGVFTWAHFFDFVLKGIVFQTIAV